MYFFHPYPSYHYGSAGWPFHIAVVAGVAWGAYQNVQYNSSPVETGIEIGKTTFGWCDDLGKKISDLNPNSDVLAVIGGGVKWVGGLYFGFGAGLGGLIGSGVPWAVKEATSNSGTSHRRSENSLPFKLDGNLNTPLNLTASFRQELSGHLTNMKYAAASVTLRTTDESAAPAFSRPTNRPSEPGNTAKLTA